MKKITGLEFLAILFNIFVGAILLVDAIKNGSNGYIYASVVCLLASFISGLCAQRGHEITKLTQEYADVNHQRLQALKEKDEADQQLSLLRQKYSRTNQPRSGGRFVKKSIPFKCPKGDYSCPYVDTMTSTLSGDCNSCKYNPL